MDFWPGPSPRPPPWHEHLFPAALSPKSWATIIPAKHLCSRTRSCRLGSARFLLGRSWAGKAQVSHPPTTSSQCPGIPSGLTCSLVLVYGQAFEVHPIISPAEQMRNRHRESFAGGGQRRDPEPALTVSRVLACSHYTVTLWFFLDFDLSLSIHRCLLSSVGVSHHVVGASPASKVEGSGTFSHTSSCLAHQVAPLATNLSHFFWPHGETWSCCRLVLPY